MRCVRTLFVPKEGNSEEQYEDAFAFNAEAGVLAVADGASAAVYARQWAQLLTHDFAHGDPFPEKDEPFWARVAQLGGQWQQAVGGSAKSWYAQEKVPQGSQASLLVVSVDRAARRFTARAVGDACLFVVAQDKLHYGFPLTRSRQFGTHPELVATAPHALKRKPKVVRLSERYPEGTRLFAMTDALAAWFLAEYEKKQKPWNLFPDESRLMDWVQQHREVGTLKNDDTTLVELALD